MPMRPLLFYLLIVLPITAAGQTDSPENIERVKHLSDSLTRVAIGSHLTLQNIHVEVNYESPGSDMRGAKYYVSKVTIKYPNFPALENDVFIDITFTEDFKVQKLEPYNTERIPDWLLKGKKGRFLSVFKARRIAYNNHFPGDSSAWNSWATWDPKRNRYIYVVSFRKIADTTDSECKDCSTPCYKSTFIDIDAITGKVYGTMSRCFHEIF
jgi:hypothetical protein